MTTTTTTPTGPSPSDLANPNPVLNAQAGSTPQNMNDGSDIFVVPDKVAAGDHSAINVADFASQLVTDPSVMFDPSMTLSDNTPHITDEQVQQGNVNTTATQGNPTEFNQTANQADTTTAQMPDTSQTSQAAQVQTATTADKVATDAQATGQHGQINQNDLVDPSQIQIDTNATANGTNATGAALNDYAKQDISNIIDTSTTAGKLLAQQLGEGNYVDSKATMKGQLDILAKEFVDPNTGQPTIPSWAAGVARNVSRIASFSGMTGTAAVAAMSQALLEASLPVAQADSQFFQTLTVKNLDNKQESIINKANVLSKLDLANLDARTTAAVTNAQAFMQMDMKNLDNDQQAEVINTQERFQSILEDAKSENANRLFVAQSQNEKDMFYDNLSSSMSQFNATQTNAMAQFNTGQENDMDKFNADMDNNRDQFYKNMQFQVDTANAKWRQDVTVTNNANDFEAASTDVKNRVGVSVEELNRLWDRADSLLDYAWKTSQNDADRKNQLALVSLKGKIDDSAADKAGTGNIIGTILGSVLGCLF
jgi:hypothetical protein